MSTTLVGDYVGMPVYTSPMVQRGTFLVVGPDGQAVVGRVLPPSPAIYMAPGELDRDELGRRSRVLRALWGVPGYTRQALGELEAERDTRRARRVR